MQSILPSSPNYHLSFRAAGLFIWMFLALPAFDPATRRGETLSPAQWATWLVLFFVFGLAFWVSSSPGSKPSAIRILALAAQTGSVVGMTASFQNYLVGFLLVLVSWQVALVLPIRAAILWATTGSALWAFFQEPHFHMGWRWGATGAFLGLQAFAIIAAALARSEARAREEQARINAELISTRELLRESSKASERMRIAGELHDLLGHHLTALCLHLEAALHSSDEQARPIVEKALATSRRLLDDVRSVVSGLQDVDQIDLRTALHSLAENVPRIQLHLSIPGELRITEAARAHAVLCCVQEITTNALKHSNAANLWIELSVRHSAIEIDARDDGQAIGNGRTGIGIASMRQRLERLGGGLTLNNGSQRGFSLRVWLPCEGPAEAHFS